MTDQEKQQMLWNFQLWWFKKLFVKRLICFVKQNKHTNTKPLLNKVQSTKKLKKTLNKKKYYKKTRKALWTAYINQKIISN